MHTPHTTTRRPLLFAFILLLLLLPAAPHPAAAQESGDAGKAAALHRRGVERAQKGKRKDALKDLTQALDLRLRLFNKEYSEQKQDAGALSRAESDARRLRYAAAAKALIETAEQYASLDPPDAGLWRGYLDTLRLLVSFAEDKRFDAETFLLGKFLKRAVITYKAEPDYTEEARRDNITGLVRLHARLDADGQVKDIVVLKSLPRGLTEKALAAARLIEFEPATLEGRSIPQLMVLEYNFNIFTRRP